MMEGRRFLLTKLRVSNIKLVEGHLTFKAMV